MLYEDITMALHNASLAIKEVLVRSRFPQTIIHYTNIQQRQNGGSVAYKAKK
jgi:hypothetical protein